MLKISAYSSLICISSFLRRMTWIEFKPLSESMAKFNNEINLKIIGFVYKSLSKLIKISHKPLEKLFKKKVIKNGKDE